MTSNAPTIRGSAQARLILYRLLSVKLTDVEQKILSADASLWNQILSTIERFIDSNAQIKSDQTVLTQAFSSIDKGTQQGLHRQIARLTGQ